MGNRFLSSANLMRYTGGGLVLILLSVAFATAQQQTGVLRGKVTSDGESVAFANVVLRGINYGGKTDSLGEFQISGIPYGSYTAVVSFVGYQSTEQMVRIQAPDVQINLTLGNSLHALDEVVVTGTMKEVSKMSSSIPVEVYSAELFRKNVTSNIFESLSLVNGVQPQINCNVCNTGDIRINGLEGPYTMVLIDGMPIVSSLSTVYGLSGIPSSMIRRVEVVKGPASTLYGSEAVGGLINIITKDGTSAPQFYSDVYATSVGELNADVGVRVRARNVTGLVGINYYLYDQKRDINSDNFTDVTLQNRISLFNKWNFATEAGKSSSLATRFFYEDRWGGEMQWAPAYRGTDVYYGESIYTRRWELIGSHPIRFIPGMQLDYSANVHHQNSFYGTTPYMADQRVGFAQFRWSKTTTRHDWLIGLPLRYTYYDDNTPGTAKDDGTNEASNVFLPGVFVQDEVMLSKKTTALLGLRYDHHTVHGNIITPRLSFKFSPNDRSVLRLTSGSGYRVVNLFTEDHAALSGSRDVIVLHALKPEKSWNTNINYVRNIILGSGFVSIDASVFYTYFRNKIVGDFLTDPTKIIYDNLSGHAVSKGATVNADLSFDSGLKFIAGFTLLDVYQKRVSAQGSERVPQLLSPRTSGTLAAGYTSPGEGHWVIDLTGRINGPMEMPVVPDDFRPSRSPWVPIFNFQVTRHLHLIDGYHLEVYGGVKNILNYVQRDAALLRPFDPFDKQIGDENPNGYTFDTTYSYAPIQGAKFFFGARFTLE